MIFFVGEYFECHVDAIIFLTEKLKHQLLLLVWRKTKVFLIFFLVMVYVFVVSQLLSVKLIFFVFFVKNCRHIF